MQQFGRAPAALLVLVAASTSPGQEEPRGERQREVKRIPPAGRELAPADRAELTAGVSELGRRIEALRYARATSR